VKNPSIWTRPLARILRLWGIACAVAGLGLMAAYFSAPPPAIGHTRRNIARHLQARGFSVQEQDIVVAGGLPRHGSRWSNFHRAVVFLGADRLSRRADVWLARMELSPGGVPLAVRDVRNLSSTHLVNERHAAVSERWVFWPSPHVPGLAHLVWLPDPDRRFRLRITPAPSDPVVTIEAGHARLAGAVEGKPVWARVDLGTGQVETSLGLTGHLEGTGAPLLAGAVKVR
jgi:hypothetical protein